MTNNWVKDLLNNSMQPQTVDDAAELLITVLDERYKLLLSNMKEDELFDLHFGLGLSIRNSLRLHDADSKLLRD